MTVTLRDLLRWPESPVRLAAQDQAGAETEVGPLDRQVAWPVLMRATSPLLPRVEAGALVLVPTPVLSALRESLPAVLRELRRHDIAALVLDPGAELRTEDQVLLRGLIPVGPNLEAALAQLLQERRASLYQRGAELDRALAEIVSSGASARRLVTVGSEWSGRDVYLLDGAGHIVASAATAGESPPPPSQDARSLIRRDAAEWYFAPDESGHGWIALRGPLGVLNEYDRLIADRLAAALAQARDDRAARSIPGGPDYEARLRPLWTPDVAGPERRASALTLGLDPTAYFAIVIQRRPARSGPTELLRALGPAGSRIGIERSHDDRAGLESHLLHARTGEDIESTVAALSAASDQEVAATGVSEAVTLDEVPEAWRRARFACELVSRQLVDGPVASWMRFDDLGPYRLLYHLWCTPVATDFITTALGALPAYDARHGGVLIPTLLAYFAHGGVAGDAALALAVHRNTLTYRLRRVAELTGRSPLDPRQQLTLHLAVILHVLAKPF